MLLADGQSLSAMLDQTLLIQIFGYVMAGVMAVVLVNRSQGGDWASLGLARTRDTASEMLTGAGFGLLLLAAWAPVGFILSGRRLQLDRLLTVLVGETSGAGLVLAAIVLVLGAPVVEEIFFRGMIYGKIARKSSRWVAVMLSSILFVMAHGTLVLPALYVLAIGVALARRTRTLWFTIAAHGAWNLAVLCLAAFVLFSPAKLFTAADGSFSLRHPASWQRAEMPPGALPMGGGLDLMLESTNGSGIIVARFPMPPGARPGDVPARFSRAAGSGALPFGPGAEIKKVHLSSPSLTQAWEVRGAMPGPGGMAVKTRAVIALPPGWSSALTIVFVCPAEGCASSGAEFDEILSSLQLNA
jgi:membrane protease YdiL (CAAX protease family)